MAAGCAAAAFCPLVLGEGFPLTVCPWAMCSGVAGGVGPPRWNRGDDRSVRCTSFLPSAALLWPRTRAGRSADCPPCVCLCLCLLLDSLSYTHFTLDNHERLSHNTSGQVFHSRLGSRGFMQYATIYKLFVGPRVAKTCKLTHFCSDVCICSFMLFSIRRCSCIL